MSTTGFLSILSIALAFHGLALAVLIVVSKKLNRLTLTYSLLLLVISLILTEYYLSYSGLEQQFPHLIAMKIPLLMLIGPCYLLWSMFKTTGRTWRRPDVLHFIHFLLMVLVLVPFYKLPGAEKLVVAASDNGWLIRNVYLVTTFLHILVYVVLTGRIVLSRKDVKEVDKALVKKLQLGLTLLLVLFGMAIGYSIAWTAAIGLSRYLFVLGMGLLINFLAYALMDKSNGFVVKPAINDEELNKLANRVRHYLENEKPYLKKGFSKSDLSEALDSNENYVSRAFNDVLHTSFSSYINRLRIEEAKKLLLDKDDKIYAVAIDSGFTSKNNFTRVFKQHTKHTPAEYRSLNKVIGHNS